MLDAKISAQINGQKNLLAFSHGVDSTALFWLLFEQGVSFDLAMVDYGKREQSRAESAAAMALAERFGKRIFLLNLKECSVFGFLNLDSFLNLKAVLAKRNNNFESHARAVRYAFFDDICSSFGYENLLLAHQLNDRLEWFFMQLGRGAGLSELLFPAVSKRGDYKVVRPLLGVSRDEILAFLDRRNLSYFVDESNVDFKFKRNFIRSTFAAPFLEQFKGGVKKSFEFLDADIKRFKPHIKHIAWKLYVVKNDKNAMRGLDRVVKILGIVLSAAQKDEIKKCFENGSECVLGGKVAIGKVGDEIFIAPYLQNPPKMSKKFKEECRILGIPRHIRAYLYSQNFDLKTIANYQNHKKLR